MAKHNKKRNIGIIYELMLRHISNCLIEGDMQGVRTATKILEKRLNKDTELFKEFRLFNAIAKSNVKNTEIAAAILTEAKAAARRTNPSKINSEKSDLIRDINYKIKDESFYYRNIPQYKEYAGIQNLINEWRKKDRSNLKYLVELEKKAIDILMEEKIEKDVFVENKNLQSSDSDKLVMKIMTEKINSRYDNLTADQKEIIKNYAIYSNEDNQDKLVSFLREKKDTCLDHLSAFERNNNNDFVGKKVDAVREKLESLNENDISDQSIVKFLTVTKLIAEIKEV